MCTRSLHRHSFRHFHRASWHSHSPLVCNRCLAIGRDQFYRAYRQHRCMFHPCCTRACKRYLQPYLRTLRIKKTRRTPKPSEGRCAWGIVPRAPAESTLHVFCKHMLLVHECSAAQEEPTECLSHAKLTTGWCSRPDSRCSRGRLTRCHLRRERRCAGTGNDGHARNETRAMPYFESSKPASDGLIRVRGKTFVGAVVAIAKKKGSWVPTEGQVRSLESKASASHRCGVVFCPRFS